LHPAWPSILPPSKVAFLFSSILSWNQVWYVPAAELLIAPNTTGPGSGKSSMTCAVVKYLETSPSCGQLSVTAAPSLCFQRSYGVSEASIPSVLEASSIALKNGVSEALQWATSTGDGEEYISERTLRRWIKRTGDRVPFASTVLDFSPATKEPALEKLENFLTQLHRRDLLALRSQWGFSLLDVPPPEKPTNTTKCPNPVFQNPRPAQNPPSEYLPRGTKSFPHRRGPPSGE